MIGRGQLTLENLKRIRTAYDDGMTMANLCSSVIIVIKFGLGFAFNLLLIGEGETGSYRPAFTFASSFKDDTTPQHRMINKKLLLFGGGE